MSLVGKMDLKNPMMAGREDRGHLLGSLKELCSGQNSCSRHVSYKPGKSMDYIKNVMFG